jgi:hypothetical protein
MYNWEVEKYYPFRASPAEDGTSRGIYLIKNLTDPSTLRPWRIGRDGNTRMATLQDIINLAKADGGKFFVIDESGDCKLVILQVEDYQRLLLGKLQKQVKQQAEDVEKINKEIIKAQLLETDAPLSEVQKPPSPAGPVVQQRTPVPRVDLRAEVIDPSFDFEAPKVEIDDL